MNHANDMLVAIQRKKAIYTKCMEDSEDIGEIMKLKKDIDLLSKEEKYWLAQVME